MTENTPLLNNKDTLTNLLFSAVIAIGILALTGFYKKTKMSCGFWNIRTPVSGKYLKKLFMLTIQLLP